MELQLRGLVLQLKGKGFQVEEHSDQIRKSTCIPPAFYEPFIQMPGM